MRYLLDTNTFIYFATDHSKLDKDVTAILQDADNSLCISGESVKELIIAYKNKGFTTKHWKTCDALIEGIEDTYGITILPVDKGVLRTYANLSLNSLQGHKDPSDHVIISHAITLGMPLISSDTRFPYYRKQGLDLILNKK